MHGPTCAYCDRGNCNISERDFCDLCEELFTLTMAKVRCAIADKGCTSPITCLSKKTCVQIQSAIKIVNGAT